MSRADFHSAHARMGALIARVHRDCIAEQTANAYADHHLGCTLHPSHEGDCLINRPWKPRFVVKEGR